MKTCPQCGRTYPDAQLACQACGTRLPEGEAAVRETVAHIDFLLGELNRWVMNGWVAPEQARRLWDEYQRRRTELLSPQAHPAVASERPVIDSLPSTAPMEEAPRPERRPSPLAAFLLEQNISYWYLIGALLLLAGVAALVRWAWGSVGHYLVFALMLALTGGLWALGRSRLARDHQITAAALTGIAALLVPLDAVALNAFGLLPFRLSPTTTGLLASGVSLPLYARLAQRQTARSFLVFFIFDAPVFLHFALQAVLPGLLHTRDTAALLAVYGYAYIPLAALYVWGAHRAESEERRRLWLTAAHVTVLVAAGLALLTGGGSAFGHLAVTLLLAGLLYAGAAWLFDETPYAYLSCGLLTLGGLLVLHHARWDVSARWYAYALLCQVFGVAFWTLGRSLAAQDRPKLALSYREGAQAVAGPDGRRPVRDRYSPLRRVRRDGFADGHDADAVRFRGQGAVPDGPGHRADAARALVLPSVEVAHLSRTDDFLMAAGGHPRRLFCA